MLILSELKARCLTIQADPHLLGMLCRSMTFLASAPTLGPLVRTLLPIMCSARCFAQATFWLSLGLKMAEGGTSQPEVKVWRCRLTHEEALHSDLIS